MVTVQIVVSRQLLVALAILFAGALSGGAIAAAQGGSTRAPQAPLGSGFTYQGQLKQGGVPVNGLCEMAFRLYDEEEFGNQVGAAVTHTVQVANGIFTAALNASGEFGADAFTGSRRWLGIAVRCPPSNGGFAALSPRQELSAAPYALSLKPGAIVGGGEARGLTVETSADGDKSTAVYGKQNGGSGIDTLFFRAGVWGDSASNSSNAGVIGTSRNSGVVGMTITGTGVYGDAPVGIGVAGYSSSGWAMYATGDATQSGYSGGWIKALALMSGGTIARCFNSQSYTQKSTAPCGFGLVKNGTGDYTLNFGFQVNNRFVSVTPFWGGGSAVIPVVSFPGANTVQVQTFSGGNTFVDSGFFITVY